MAAITAASRASQTPHPWVAATQLTVETRMFVEPPQTCIIFQGPMETGVAMATRPGPASKNTICNPCPFLFFGSFFPLCCLSFPCHFKIISRMPLGLHHMRQRRPSSPSSSLTSGGLQGVTRPPAVPFYCWAIPPKTPVSGLSPNCGGPAE